MIKYLDIKKVISKKKNKMLKNIEKKEKYRLCSIYSIRIVKNTVLSEANRKVAVRFGVQNK